MKIEEWNTKKVRKKNLIARQYTSESEAPGWHKSPLVKIRYIISVLATLVLRAKPNNNQMPILLITYLAQVWLCLHVLEPLLHHGHQSARRHVRPRNIALEHIALVTKAESRVEKPCTCSTASNMLGCSLLAVWAQACRECPALVHYGMTNNKEYNNKAYERNITATKRPSKDSSRQQTAPCTETMQARYQPAHEVSLKRRRQDALHRTARTWLLQVPVHEEVNLVTCDAHFSLCAASMRDCPPATVKILAVTLRARMAQHPMPWHGMTDALRT